MTKPTPLFLLFILLVLFTACDDKPGSTENQSAPGTSGATSSTVAISKEDAEKLIKRLATQDGCKDSTAEMRMSFTDSEGKSQQMDFRLQRKYDGAKVSTLVTILAPKEEGEKALLALAEAGKPTDAVSYLAGLKKIAHLKSDNPLNFRGSKSTVQEMLGIELDSYEVGEIKAVDSSGEVNIHLEAKPNLNLAYPQINAIFGGKDKLIRRFELLDAKGEKIKTITAAEVKAVQNYQTITKMEIEDHKNNLKLIAETRNIKYDSNLPAAIFTEENLIKNVTAASQKLIQ